MANIRRSPQAEIDLEGILDDLNAKNPRVAERYAVDFAEKAKILAQFPEIGRARPEIAPNLRSLVVYPYVNINRIEGDDVQMIRILHDKQELRRILREELGE